MLRGWVRALGLASLLAVVGCTQDASLHIAWDFQGTEPASSGCGKHGVDSVLLTGAADNGDGLRQVVLCTPGQATVSVKPGNWMVAVAMLGPEGQTMEPSGDTPDPTGTAAVTVDTPGSVLIHLTPVQACNDGVDNDGDGRVDLDDPDCHGNPDGGSE
ncbi:MAG TPA: hypothetical protein VMT03_07690 [Polyangia bacterium]|nr:hypothetical protein [Polyangia bacterium]